VLLKFPLFFVSRICYNYAMKKILVFLPLFAICGCLSPAPAPSVSYWLMEYRSSSAAGRTPKYEVARLSQIVVSQPYSGERFVVLRKDGTVAFDSCNLFAAPPLALMRGIGVSALTASGLFSDVVDASSGASAPVSVELGVSRLALDCRQEDVRRVVADVSVRLLKGRSVVATAEGSGAADASDRDFGVAYSKAVSEALSSALSKLR